jgi:hypothetical protein
VIQFAKRPSSERPTCRWHESPGSVPAAKYSVRIIDCSVWPPSSSVTGTASQPPAGRLPDSRQICTATMRGALKYSLVVAVAGAMKRAQSGTATSAA